MVKKQSRKNKGILKKQTRSKNKPSKKKIIIGKIYADWCGHCNMLKPEWEKMKNMIKHNTGRSLTNVEFTFSEMGETEENNAKNMTLENQISNFNRKHFPQGNKQIMSDGYPTLFKVCRKKIDYYNGSRSAEDMYNWYTQKC